MTTPLLNRYSMIPSQKTARRKTRKRTVAQILREAYSRHCHDQATRHALRLHLKK